MALLPDKHNYPLRLGLPLRLLVRLVQLNVIFVPLLWLVVPLYFCGPHGQRLLYRSLHWGLCRAGATFTKLGQWASSRPDILPAELCVVLSQLHTRAPAHGMAWNRHAIRSAFGVELDDLFTDFDAVPVGSGTVAQVHRAALQRPDGCTSVTVAVKICHPNVEETVERDLQLMLMAAEIANLVPALSWISLPEEARHFAYMMRQQLDLRHEAYSLGQLARNFSRWRSVHVPVPVYPYVSKHVLTETFAGGVPISELVGARSRILRSEGPEQRAAWARVCRQAATCGLQSFLQMLLWDNFVHADLHPGNILVRLVDRRGRVRWDTPITPQLVELACLEELGVQLVYLDTGLVTRLSTRDFENFCDLFAALVLAGDGYRAGRLLIERAPASSRRNVVDEQGFCREMDRIVTPIFGSFRQQAGARSEGKPRRSPPLDFDFDLGLDRLAIAPTLMQVFDLVRKHQVRLDGSFTNLVMSFLCVEGLGRQLAPDLNLAPFLVQAAVQYLATNAAHTISSRILPHS